MTEEYYCWYCSNKCNYKFNITRFDNSIISDKYICQVCSETFKISSLKDYIKGKYIKLLCDYPQYHSELDFPQSWRFTCNEFAILAFYPHRYLTILRGEPKFRISHRDSDKLIVNVPPFYINFTEKEKLYNKLKTISLLS